MTRIFYFVGILLWISVLMLCLELVGGVARYWTVESNPYIAAELSGDSSVLDASIARLNRTDPELPPHATIRVGVDSISRPSVSDFIGDRDLRSAESLSHVAQQWPGWTHEQRDFYAMLSCRFIFEVDASTNDYKPYGSWMTGRLGYLMFDSLFGSLLEASGIVNIALIKDAVEQAFAGGKSVESSAGDLGSIFEAPIIALPIASGSSKVTSVLLLLTASIPDMVEMPRNQGEMDSPWHIPFVEYHPNYRRGEGVQSGVSMTNNFGFHDQDFVVPKPKDNFRILCIGGSTTEEGVGPDATYPHYLEELLHKSFAMPIEVYNCGVSGKNSEGIMYRIRDYLALEPDLVVFYTGINDLHTTILPTIDVSSLPFWKHLLRHSRFVNHYFPTLIAPSSEEVESGFDMTIKMLRAVRMVTSEQGIDMVICSIPTPDASVLTTEENVYFDWHARTYWGRPYWNLAAYSQQIAILNSRLERFSADTTVGFVPLAEAFSGCGIETFGDICHMRERGIRAKASLLAEALAPYLREKIGQPISVHD